MADTGENNQFNFLDVVPTSHPQYFYWYHFIYSIHSAALSNATDLLYELELHPNGINLEIFSNFLRAHGLESEALLPQNTRNEQGEDNEIEAPVQRNHADADINNGAINAVFQDDNLSLTDILNGLDEEIIDGIGQHRIPAVVSMVSLETSVQATQEKRSSGESVSLDIKSKIKRRMVISSSDTEDDKSTKQGVFKQNLITTYVISSDGSDEEDQRQSLQKDSMKKFKTVDVFSSPDSENESKSIRQKPKVEIKRNVYNINNFVVSSNSSDEGYRVRQLPAKVRQRDKKYKNEKSPTSNKKPSSSFETKSGQIQVQKGSKRDFRPTQKSSTSPSIKKLQRNDQTQNGCDWICPNCRNDFMSRYTRDRHFKTCSGATPARYKCQIKGCGASFAWSHDLINHRNEHSDNPKVFTCPYCHQNFLLQTKRIRHIQKYHPKNYLKYFGGTSSKKKEQ